MAFRRSTRELHLMAMYSCSGENEPMLCTLVALASLTQQSDPYRFAMPETAEKWATVLKAEAKVFGGPLAVLLAEMDAQETSYRQPERLYLLALANRLGRAWTTVSGVQVLHLLPADVLAHRKEVHGIEVLLRSLDSASTIGMLVAGVRLTDLPPESQAAILQTASQLGGATDFIRGINEYPEQAMAAITLSYDAWVTLPNGKQQRFYGSHLNRPLQPHGVAPPANSAILKVDQNAGVGLDFQQGEVVKVSEFAAKIVAATREKIIVNPVWADRLVFVRGKMSPQSALKVLQKLTEVEAVQIGEKPKAKTDWDAWLEQYGSELAKQQSDFMPEASLILNRSSVTANSLPEPGKSALLRELARLGLPPDVQVKLEPTIILRIGFGAGFRTAEGKPLPYQATIRLKG